VVCLIGNGIVIDLHVLNEEIAELRKRNVQLPGRLYLSQRAHVIMPYHIAIENLRAEILDIGTTKKGIGPAYEDKAAGVGIRITDFATGELRRKLKNNLTLKKPLGIFFDVDNVYDHQMRLFERVACYVANTSYLLNDCISKGENVLFESAQGTLLDIDHGTFPFVTSSNATIDGMNAGSSIGALRFDSITGVVKAYTTRVGHGPFPTEQDNNVRHTLREKGQKFSATTGRPRRCGRLDTVPLK
jgi:adenylosuccinate synthase